MSDHRDFSCFAVQTIIGAADFFWLRLGWKMVKFSGKFSDLPTRRLECKTAYLAEHVFALLGQLLHLWARVHFTGQTISIDV